MGIPTVGTHINGLIDAIADGKTGILVPSRDAGALAEALKKLLDDPGLTGRMGHAARQRCREKFDATIINRKMAEEYIRLWGT